MTPPRRRRRVGWIALAAGFTVLAGLALGSSWATSMPNDVRIPIVSEHPKGAPPDPALFRHGSHAQLNCYACHPGLFPRYPLGFTHAQMNEGQFCGACHDGSGAFSVNEARCERCHVPR